MRTHHPPTNCPFIPFRVSGGKNSLKSKRNESYFAKIWRILRSTLSKFEGFSFTKVQRYCKKDTQNFANFILGQILESNFTGEAL